MPIAIRRPLLSSCAASCPRTHPPYVKRFAAICPAKSRLVRELLPNQGAPSCALGKGRPGGLNLARFLPSLLFAFNNFAFSSGLNLARWAQFYRFEIETGTR